MKEYEFSRYIQGFKNQTQGATWSISSQVVTQPSSTGLGRLEPSHM